MNDVAADAGSSDANDASAVGGGSNASQTARRSSASRVFINAASGAGARIAMMCVGFLLTPYILRTLGIQSFGLWAVVGSLAGYLGMLDLGLGGAFVRFMTQFLESGRKDEARRTFSFGVIFYAVFATALTAIAYAISPFVVHLLSMPSNEYGLATAAFRALFAILLGNLVLGLPAMLLISMHRMDITNKNIFIGYLVYVAATVILLHDGRGIWGVIIAQGIQVVFTALMQYFSARRMFGALWGNPWKLDRAVVRSLFSFGGWTQLNAILTIVNLDIGRFISASVINVSSVTYYELGSKIAFISRMLPGYFLDAVLPAAAAADVHSDEQALERMYASGSLYLMFATFTVAGFLIGASYALLQVWLGSVYPYVPTIIVCLAIGYAVNSMVSIGTIIFRARGMPKYETYYTAVGTVANIVATLVFAQRFGTIGVAMGSAMGWFASSAFFLVVFHRISKLSWWNTVGKNAVRLAIVTGICSVLLSITLHAPFMAKALASRVEGLLVLSASAILFTVLVFALSILTKLWSREDIDRGRRLISFGR